MNPVRFTLIADGAGDRRLVPIVQWTLRQYVEREILGSWADLYFVNPRPRTLKERVGAAIKLYPADLFVVHRDAEAEPAERRYQEISASLAGMNLDVVRLVPVRMQEAWLLFNEPAIRHAAKNPHGRQRLDIPRLQQLEALPDPKGRLIALLQEASGLTGRRLRAFQAERAAHRLSELIEDFSPLRALPAFRQFEDEVEIAAEGL